VKFRRYLGADSIRVIHADIIGQAFSPVAITPATVTDLRQPQRADLMIITNRALEPSLDEYVTYRSRGRSVQVVTVENIMDNFSYGLYDPAAIRDLLKYAYENYPAPAPSAALFVGDANYDYRDNLSTGVPNWVPSYVIGGDDANSDDNYVYFGAYGLLDSDTSYWGGGRGYDMMTARWPVRSGAEIDAIIDKLTDYESGENLGAWRSRIALVADDEFGQFDNEVYHTSQTETLQRNFIPAELTRNKIYMWEYPFVNQDKPAVTEDIIDAFNDGSLVMNYVGHGNPDVWAHEHVLERGSDLPRIQNYDRLPLVFAASCAIGFFDDPRREGMAEDFMASTSGGAIGVISATRLVYSGPNSLLNQQVYSNLFGPDKMSVCEALYAAKLQRQYPDSIPRPIENDRSYVYMGDPYLHLAEPELTVEYTEVPDSLVALSRTRVAGRLVDEQGSPVAVDGVLEVSVFDAYREKMFATNLDTVDYSVDGPEIFRGSATVSGGSFSFEFIPPLDISYGRPGARISAYAVGGGLDGLGTADAIPVSQSLVASSDSTGPRVEYSLVGRDNFQNGDVVTARDVLEIRLSDSSGINLADGIGHGIVLTMDDNSDAPVNLSGRFAYDQDDFTTGGLQYALSDLPPGKHRLKITAWDNANNVTVEELSVVMALAGELAINDLLNYPNPMADQTTFHFELTTPTDRLSLEIFTLSGKKIWSVSELGLGADRYPNDRLTIVWDGRDLDGDRVATGVYIYKLSAVPESGEAVEEFGKVVVLN
ncbi:type IX secretion system sortase PorU, partial [candidate division GN15 bacterium]|nr:type IX secretion system sortase PorU [candidate division GN15 bacterium]